MLQSQKNLPNALSDFPVPDAAALAHSNKLKAHIHSLIQAEQGAISFRRFMESALYEPGLGYYSAGATKLGEQGDFVTAPEISSLFSYCIARQCQQILQITGEGTILELGAGTGRMAGDIMLALSQSRSLPERYLIVETSADLRQRQQTFLKQQLPADIYDLFHWLDALDDLTFRGIILANEVMDALPVERIQYMEDSFHRMLVANDDKGFLWQREPVSNSLAIQIDETLGDYQPQFPEGYTTEINSLLPEWIRSLADVLQQGLILLIDYGYPRYEFYHPQRVNGTLLCHYRHRAHHDPFLYVGLQDITASVDFTAVAEAASAAGLSVDGFCSQANFLLSCGLDQLVGRLTEGDDGIISPKLSGEIKRLTLPSEMGERFKVIGLGKDIEKPVLGFSMFDHRERL